MRLQDEPFCISHGAPPDEFPQRGIRDGQRNLWHGLCLLGSNRLALRYPVACRSPPGFAAPAACAANAVSLAVLPV